ncbi:ABC-type nitrate/sulfonate/bicarbonate transport system permease component [Tamaricihabitans halophyticus]|uniref:ABC-type nitrate/sulfonate/bicarbonate transport system permease component n=1 Tax=Tamaricihabitans halophyticus TaxID=1262583 RepID=A0A4R2R5E7_9PSEU|nr:ABC transporter permease [Tamaricihabitans halophyticus]TCP57204.1 ABC-type nitrate/sulfonate/bicarbonate transport system permease component [Tamaricihabitans halophyticus]
MTRRIGYLLLPAILPIAVLLGYGIWSIPAQNFYFPPLPEIIGFFRDIWLFDRIGSDLVPSLARMLSAYAISIGLGVPIGLALGFSRLLRTACEPVVEFLRALPAPALIPFALLIFGAGNGSKLFVIVLGAIWPILLNSLDGARGVDRTQLDMARSYQVPRLARLRHIVLPAASPRIFAGMRTSLAIALILMVVSEMVASSHGLGYFVLQAQRSFAIPEMWTGIILLGILGFLLNAIFLRIENRVLFWHRAVTRKRPTKARSEATDA